MPEVKELAKRLLDEYERIYSQDRRGEIAPGDFEALARVALEFCEERERENERWAKLKKATPEEYGVTVEARKRKVLEWLKRK